MIIPIEYVMPSYNSVLMWNARMQDIDNVDDAIYCRNEYIYSVGCVSRVERLLNIDTN